MLKEGFVNVESEKQNKIKALEEGIKNLHFNPSQLKHGFSEKETREIFTNFWNYHMAFVIEKSKKLAEKYKADVEAVWLGAMLHDIARLDEAEPHDEIGAEKAYNILLEKGFSEELAAKVREIVFTHRCRNHNPENLEQKILATADAMSHFEAPFYLWVARDSKMSMQEMLEKNLAKVERDYKDKIFFEEEREEIRKQYEVLKAWCEYKM